MLLMKICTQGKIIILKSEAIDEFESSNFVKEKLGTQIFNEYIEAKKIEWNEFNNAITDWEIKKYLERF